MDSEQKDIITGIEQIAQETRELQKRIVVLSRKRSRLVRQLSEIHGWTYKHIAETLRVSVPRISQIVGLTERE